MPNIEQGAKSSSVHDESFSAGLRTGLDPHTAEQDESQRNGLSLQSLTSLRSPWLHKLCKVCGHTFRPGDEVRILEGKEVVHDMPGFRCDGHDGLTGLGDGLGRIVDFYEGIALAWPMPVDVPILRLEAGHWLLAPSRDGLRRPVCRVCGHSFRPMDHVVICPCRPNDPSCRVAIHRDLFRQLHCYDEWKNGLNRNCLAFA